MKLTFTKMEGAGNDFVVLDCTVAPFLLNALQLRKLADRHFGVGCDQVLVVERTSMPGVDFRYRIFNADGGEVEQCGNGARCFVKFVHARGLSAKREFRVETLSGVIVPRLEDDGEVSVNMGPPTLELPLTEKITLNGETLELTILSMGNPHAVQVVADIDAAPVATQGPALEHHPRFPNRVNAGYLQLRDRQRIALRVWERGAGETLACGTGACAAVVTGILRGLLDSPVAVEARGGTLTVSWAGGDNAVWLKGPARSVFEAEIEI
ncbi:MAG: diaminopimelate epimerase [Betaproteobacteria bacterium]|nr:diaminopimelate epimerase [Betaproteobacteria bacterium]MSQ89412.1 diaminopimelate epimerase [Betaproteobacteria bacterium]